MCKMDFFISKCNFFPIQSEIHPHHWSFLHEHCPLRPRQIWGMPRTNATSCVFSFKLQMNVGQGGGLGWSRKVAQIPRDYKDELQLEDKNCWIREICLQLPPQYSHQLPDIRRKKSRWKSLARRATRSHKRDQTSKKGRCMHISCDSDCLLVKPHKTCRIYTMNDFAKISLMLLCLPRLCELFCQDYVNYFAKDIFRIKRQILAFLLSTQPQRKPERTNKHWDGAPIISST